MEPGGVEDRAGGAEVPRVITPGKPNRPSPPNCAGLGSRTAAAADAFEHGIR
jgi:hypothetical protein